VSMSLHFTVADDSELTGSLFLLVHNRILVRSISGVIGSFQETQWTCRRTSRRPHLVSAIEGSLLPERSPDGNALLYRAQRIFN
jgi:hypothetical protein